MATDLSKTSDAQLLDLINTDNSSSLDETHVLFDIPTPLVDDPDGKNTTIDVVSRPNGGYNGSVSIKYDRLNLNGFEVYGDPILVIPDGGGLPEIVEAFNVLYSANIELAEDIDETVTLPTLDYQLQPYTLTSKAESLAYFGSIDVSVRFETTELSSVIVTSTFEGLEYPIPMGELLIGNISQLADLPSNRYVPTLAVVDNILYIIGGAGTLTGNANSLNTRYFIDTNTYDQNVMAASPSARRNTASVVSERKIFIIGGALANGSSSTVVTAYDVDNNIWTTLTPLPEARRYTTALAIDNFIYVYAGYAGGTLTNTLFRYNIISNVWETLANSPFYTDIAMLMVHYDGKLFCSGRQTYLSTAADLTDDVVQIYDIGTDTWSYEPLTINAAINKGDLTNSVIVGNRAYVTSGGGIGWFDVDAMTIEPIVNPVQNNGKAVAGNGGIFIVGYTDDPNGNIFVT